MTKDDLRAKLRAAGFEVHSQVRVQSHDRWRLLLSDGSIVDSLDDGSWTVFGHHRGAVRAALGSEGELLTAAVGIPMIVEKTKVVAEPEANRVRLELTCRDEIAAPPATTAFFTSEDIARELANHLSAAAYRMRICREQRDSSAAAESRAANARRRR